MLRFKDGALLAQSKDGPNELCEKWMKPGGKQTLSYAFKSWAQVWGTGNLWAPASGNNTAVREDFGPF